MSARPQVPQFGVLLRDHIQSVPPEAQPAFLAGLERSAADRYRTWAEQIPDHAETLLECAASEDRIADIVIRSFPIDDDLREQVDDALPAAIEVYYQVFAPHSPADQLFLQSEAEIQGSQAWVRLAEAITDDTLLDSLQECTALELRSSAAVKSVLDELESTRV